jgi:hypothetical protein
VGVVVFNYFYLSLMMKIYVRDEDEFGEDLNDGKFWWLWWRNLCCCGGEMMVVVMKMMSDEDDE